MVQASDIATFADADPLVTQSPGTVRIESPDNNAGALGAGISVGFAQTGSPIRSWDVTVNKASKVEMRYLRTVWDQSLRGALPVTVTPPWGGGAIPALIMNTDLRRQFNSNAGTYRITFREYIG